MNRFTTECIVLKSINYKDADKIYTFYSKDKGKISVTVKGVRKISSKRKGTLDTCNHIRVGITEAQNSFNYLSEVVPLTSFNTLKSDLQLSIKGYYVLELCDRLVETEDPNPKIFELLLKTLRLLDGRILDPVVAVGYFELLLMKSLGYELRFDACVKCGKRFSQTWQEYRLNFAIGGLICDDCKNGMLIKSSDAMGLYLLEKGKISKDAHISAETLSLIKAFIQSVLDERFRTVRMFGAF